MDHSIICRNPPSIQTWNFHWESYLRRYYKEKTFVLNYDVPLDTFTEKVDNSSLHNCARGQKRCYTDLAFQFCWSNGYGTKIGLAAHTGAFFFGFQTLTFAFLVHLYIFLAFLHLMHSIFSYALLTFLT